MRRNKIIYWIFTGIIFAFDSLIPALTSNTQLAIDGIRRLGFPDYFRVELTVFKVLGGIVLILPMVPRRYKEWAYAGFGFYLGHSSHLDSRRIFPQYHPAPRPPGHAGNLIRHL
jgi:hypothetical protein